MRPEEPKPKKKPQVLGVADPNDVPPRTPRNERDEREATRLATEAAQRAADAEASKTPKEPSDEPTGGTGGNSTPPKALTDQGTPPDPNKQKPEFSKLFAPPAPRRFLGADGRIPAHIANAPVMGRDPPPPRESRLQRKRRVKAEKEAMIKQLEDEGRDVQAILAQTEGVPDLLAFPLVSAPFAKRDCELMMCRRQMNKMLLKTMPRIQKIKRKNASSWAWPPSRLRMMRR
jgi:hypothetical protein